MRQVTRSTNLVACFFCVDIKSSLREFWETLIAINAH